MMSKLTKKDVQKVQLRSWMYQWQSFSYEAMQATGFTQAIGPAIEKIYEGNDDVIADKLQKYLAFITQKILCHKSSWVLA